MALTRRFLVDLGIEKDLIQGILDEHGNTMELVKEKAKEDAEKQSEKLNDKIAALQEKIDNAPEPPAPDGVDWKQKYDDEVAAHSETKKTMKKTYDDYVAGVETEKATTAKREAIRKHLAADGANQKLIGLLEKEFDLMAVELDGDKVKGWDELSKSVKENYADVFGKTTVEGADVPNPPGGGGAKNPWLKDSRNLAQQTKIYRENPALAIEMAAAAGIKLR